MTLKGKRKALNNNPEAQLSAISEAFNGKVPVKPLPRCYPAVAWQEGNTYHIVKLTRGNLRHIISKAEPQNVTIFCDAIRACSYLADTYYRKVSLADLQAAINGPVPVPMLAEGQYAIICWIRKGEDRFSAVSTWEYCIVTPDGIKTGTTQGKPKPPEGFPGPLMLVFSIYSCRDLLRQAFQLDVKGVELTEAFNKVVKVPKILAV